MTQPRQKLVSKLRPYIYQSTTNLYIKIPIVELKVGLKVSLQNRCTNAVLPTPESPMQTIINIRCERPFERGDFFKKMLKN